MSNNPKCPVFGCTIPRGIPHEPPAGVSVVMHDPVAPLNADERAELEELRRNAIWRTSLWANEKARAEIEDSVFMYGPGLPVEGKKIPVGTPLNPGRKLRDALLMAGHNDQLPAGQAPGNAFADGLDKRHDWHGITVSDWTEVRRLSVVQIAGRIATGIVLAVGVASILILSAMTAGWL